MTPLDPRPWDELTAEEQLDLMRLNTAVREWNEHKPPVSLRSVKTRRGK